MRPSSQQIKAGCRGMPIIPPNRTGSINRTVMVQADLGIITNAIRKVILKAKKAMSWLKW
jgi:hypothetical protein